MVKSATRYVCSECGWDGLKWVGRCPQCGQWGTVEEFHEARPAASSSRTAAPGRTSRTQAAASIVSAATPITQIDTSTASRLSTGFDEFDRVLGGGIVPGSVVLIAGEPGIGKSTLLLETAGNIAAGQPNGSVLYVSGEESQAQVRLRASRVNAMEQNLLLASTTDLATVLGLIERTRPTLAIVDSAQTIVSQDVDGISGGSTQVREVASALIDTAKTLNIPVLLVGHVTKDGSIAGPRTLEHLVDVVCQFEGDPETALRMLRAVKNRFGPTDEVGCFDMSGEGIEEVSDPSGLFLSSADERVEGTCVTFTLDGHRSLPIEIQALVTRTNFGLPRRTSVGIDYNRVNLLMAVLEKRAGLHLGDCDAYVNLAGGMKLGEPAIDLGVVMAVVSSFKNKVLDPGILIFGEVGLSGEVRGVSMAENRVREAEKLGFTACIMPKANIESIQGKYKIRLIGVANIKEAMGYL